MRAVAVALALAVALAASGCVSLTGRSAGRWVDDKAITAKVKTGLAQAELNTLTRINVDTYEGVVYLSGVVDTEATRRRLEDVARAVPNVEQVVTNLQIRGAAVAASPGTAPAARRPATTHPLMSRLPGLARIETDDAAGRSDGPWLAYDGAGRHVATVYSVPMSQLAQRGLDDVRARHAAVDHVAILPIAVHPDAPQGYYHVVLWHVTRDEAARLR